MSEFNGSRGRRQRTLGVRYPSIGDQLLTAVKKKMADVSGQAVLNEAALKRLDPYVKKVIDSAKFVALYTFKLKENKWEKTGVEGSLFVYSRTGEPFYNILVLNRLNTNNLIEPISSKLTLQLHEPFLFYLNSKCRLYGMWFYKKEECTRLASLIVKLMKELTDRKQSPNNVKPPNGHRLDICNMLMRAQEAYNTSKISNETGSEESRLGHQDCDTPQSVMEFFAKAVSAPKTVPIPSPHIRPQSEEGDKGLANPLIHQLMSNPVHLVEHIEKQQRMVTPQLGDMPSNKVMVPLIRQSGDSNRKETENGCAQVSPTSLSALFSSPVPDCEAYFGISPSSSVTETPKKPALMPPAMFTPQNHKESPSAIKLEPLDRNQLFQAINYLLRNDPVFMTKIHEAYVKSLADKVL